MSYEADWVGEAAFQHVGTRLFFIKLYLSNLQYRRWWKETWNKTHKTHFAVKKKYGTQFRLKLYFPTYKHTWDNIETSWREIAQMLIRRWGHEIYTNMHKEFLFQSHFSTNLILRKHEDLTWICVMMLGLVTLLLPSAPRRFLSFHYLIHSLYTILWSK
jgi:hypothetical protein